MISLRLVALGLSLGAAWWLGSLVAAHLLGEPSRLSRAALGSGVGLVSREMLGMEAPAESEGKPNEQDVGRRSHVVTRRPSKGSL